MSYRGNSSLSEEIRQRVEQTFDQTLTLAEDGKAQEALLGCDFILRLDPSFEPATRLRDRLAGTDEPIDVADLRLDATPQPPPATATPVEEPEPVAEPAPEASPASAADAAPPPAATLEASDLAEELTGLLERRELRTLLNLATEHAEEIRVDPALVSLVRDAQSRFEAEPYVRSFLEAAGRLKQEGRVAEAKVQLEKARELDPTHPELWSIVDDGRLDGGEDETEGGVDGADDGEAAVAAAPPDSDEAKIARLLDEGQEAFDDDDLQAAIDAWSRIFLIDIDHAEASARIEKARTLKAEQEREVEEIFHEALSLMEMGSTDEARGGFERVLELAPNHLGARQYMDEMVASEEAETEGPSAAASAVADGDEAAPGSAREGADEPAAETTAAPAAARGPRPRPAAPAAKKSLAASLLSPRFLAIGGAVLLVALGVAWFLYSRRDGLFPNSSVPEEAPATPGPIERAQGLQRRGETANAIALLRRLPESHPRHSEAQALIAQWETLVADAAGDEEEAPSEADLARRESLIARGREAARVGRFLRATESLERADAIAPLEGSDVDLLDLSQDEIASLERPLQLFRQGDWEFALPDLWRLHQTDPTDADVRRLMVDSYYNLGVRNLQRRDVTKATEMFGDAAGLAVDDAELERLIRFTEQYVAKPLDLRYRIFVKYLTFR